MICSYIGCNRLATWFNEYNTPFHIRKLDDATSIPAYRMPVCHVHKCPESQPFESLEMRDSDDVFPVVMKPQEFLACKHLQSEINAELRTVKCVKCGEKLDPVEVLSQIAKAASLRNYRINAMADADRKSKKKYDRINKRLAERAKKDWPTDHPPKK